MWKVIGAERDTGADVEVEVDAADEASARRSAGDRGIFVAAVYRIEPPPARAVRSAAERLVADSSVAEAWVPDSSFALPLVVDPAVVDRLVAEASVDDPSVNDLWFPEPPAAGPTDVISPPVAVVVDAPVSAGVVAGDANASVERTVSERDPSEPVQSPEPRQRPESVNPPKQVQPAASEAPETLSPPPTTEAAAEAVGRPAAVRPARRVKVRRKGEALLSGTLADLLSEPQPLPPPRTHPPRPAYRAPQRRPTPRPVRWPDEATRPRSSRRRREAVALAAALGVAAAAGLAIVAIQLGPPRASRAGLPVASSRDTAADGANATAAIPAAGDLLPVGGAADRASDRTPDPIGGDAVRAASSDLSAMLEPAGPPRARQGPVEVVLLSAAVQRFAAATAAESAFGAGAPSRLVVVVRVRNASASSKLTYRPWSAGGVVAYAQEPRLLDDAGRRYRLVGFDFGRDAASAAAELSPGEAATDVLAFEAPSGAFTHLDLELPPGNAASHGVFALTLRIPASAVCR